MTLRKPFPVGEQCNVLVAELHINPARALRKADEQTVEGIFQTLSKGGSVPPLTVKSDGEVIDGRHRLIAFKRRQIKTTDVYVISNTGS